MRRQWDRAPVVVGVDGSLAARRAVRFAAEEAALRGLPLRIVTATPWPAMREPTGRGAARADLQMLVDADAALTEAAELAEKFVPAACVATVTAVGWAAATLVDESRSAELVVVGNRGLGGFSGLLLGSVAVGVSTHAECPVVIVRDREPCTDDDPVRAAVVVGVDGSGNSQGTLAAAFHEADLHHAPVLAVLARAPLDVVGPGTLPPAIFEDANGGRGPTAALAEVLDPFRDKYPEVAVVARACEGRAADVLVAASERALLLVVGSRGPGPLAGLMLGSVSQAVIHHARCTVLVVRSARTGPDEA